MRNGNNCKHDDQSACFQKLHLTLLINLSNIKQLQHNGPMSLFSPTIDGSVTQSLLAFPNRKLEESSQAA